MLEASMKILGSIEFEKWTFVWRKLKSCHNDIITHSIFMKLKYESTKGISKRHTEFHFDWTQESGDPHLGSKQRIMKKKIDTASL